MQKLIPYILGGTLAAVLLALVLIPILRAHHEAVPTPIVETPRAVWVAGDSIGVGIASVAGLPSVAIVGEPMTKALAEFAGIPDHTTVIISLGTNDAIAGRSSGTLGPYFIYAQKHDMALVWVGPPCILTWWGKNAAAFSDWLGKHVVRHVELADKPMCAVNVRAKDGVHFTTGGYRLLWAKIRTRLPT